MRCPLMVHVTCPVGGVELYRQVSVTSAPGVTGPDTFSDRTAVGEESGGERKGGGMRWGSEQGGGDPTMLKCDCPVQ